MRIVVIAVGKMRDRAVGELTRKYSKRLPASCKIEWVEVPAASGREEAGRALAKEAERIKKRIPQRAYVAALSERGKQMDSMAFAKWIGSKRDRGRDVCFIIGGASGIDPGLLGTASETISLSRLTFPHEMTRAILAEQIYRAFSILRNEPYHRE